MKLFIASPLWNFLVSAPNPCGCSFRGNIALCTSAKADRQDSAKVRTCATRSCRVANTKPLVLSNQNEGASGAPFKAFSRFWTRVDSCESGCTLAQLTNSIKQHRNLRKGLGG